MARRPAAHHVQRLLLRPLRSPARRAPTAGRWPPATIGARAFDLLTTLLENPGRLLTKNDLLDRVWPGLVVEEANLHLQVSSLRKLLGQRRSSRPALAKAAGLAPARSCWQVSCAAIETARAAQSVLRSIELEAALYVHVALWCARCGRMADASRLIGCAETCHAAHHNAWEAVEVVLSHMIEAESNAALGSAVFERLREVGAAMTGDEPHRLLCSVLDAPVSPGSKLPASEDARWQPSALTACRTSTPRRCHPRRRS